MYAYQNCSSPPDSVPSSIKLLCKNSVRWLVQKKRKKRKINRKIQRDLRFVPKPVIIISIAPIRFNLLHIDKSAKLKYILSLSLSFFFFYEILGVYNYDYVSFLAIRVIKNRISSITFIVIIQKTTRVVIKINFLSSEIDPEFHKKKKKQ